MGRVHALAAAIARTNAIVSAIFIHGAEAGASSVSTATPGTANESPG